MRGEKTREIAICAVLSALAVVLGGAERFVPLPRIGPWVKPGLSNIAVLTALYAVRPRTAVFTAFIKTALCALLFGGAASFLYGFFGAALSLCVMLLMKKKTGAGLLGVSASGGVAHNFGQAAAAVILTGTPRILFYAPALIVTGVAAGALVACAAAPVIKTVVKLYD
ncbi:MAG: Gx transporter family protein [Clostridiales bacterium]|nr:Gx transporter family protein [Clostridiales bacterium]